MKKTLHIIPHSHWDREWYMGFDRHRVHLVELFDALITTMEQNPDYTYYHMDGQFAPIEDYLEIKPQMKDRLYALIRAGRIQVGPWYILQDEYLTSGEANVRNMLYGLRWCREIGADPLPIGYYPDAFGNVSQQPQILNGFGFTQAVFGRGLNDLGSNNAVVKQNGITSSELRWQSPDGSEVVAVIFANWYHNAMELPTEPEELRRRVGHIVRSTERFAQTDELLGMNGCDHQPVQTNLHEVIRLANQVQDEVEVKQSNFRDYMSLISSHRDSLPPFRGEINGQYTEGYYLLISTASARVDVKQKNRECSLLLERIAEPLNLLSSLYGDEYRAEFLRYAWKKLMQNHPHDSICSCSADDVYDEMNVRFLKSFGTADEMKKQALEYLADGIDTSALGDVNLTVFNLDPHKGAFRVKAYIDLDENDPAEYLTFYDQEGKRVKASVKKLGRTFTYTLPKDRFRQPRYVSRFEAELLIPDMPGLGWKTLRVEKEGVKVSNGVKWTVTDTELSGENGLIRVSMKKDGSFDLTDLKTGRVYENCNLMEDQGDQGNLYLFRASGEAKTSAGCDAAPILSELTEYSVTFEAHPKIEGCDCDFTTYVTVTEGIARADIRTVVENRAENHRIRALFPAGVPAKTDLAEGQFDLVRRDITPWENWKCPDNPQRCMAFFAVESEEEKDPGSLLVGGRGLCEYEVLRDGKNTMALNLLRAVGEIGDWGVFPTPKGQCIGTYTLEYTAVPYAAEQRGDAYNEGYFFYDDAFCALQTGKHEGTIPAENLLLSVDTPLVRMSALKRVEDGSDAVLRCFNLSEQPVMATFTGNGFDSVCESMMDERPLGKILVKDGRFTVEFGAKKIMTFRLSHSTDTEE